ncbi:MAG: Asp-tRNA(Asn)/Glu-tRNA(Gln) amidotransferase subunit GatC [Myxococcota bacterium]
MAIDADEVRRIARLAHLELPEGSSSELFDEATLNALARDLDRILEHVRDLSEVDVEGVPPTAHGVPIPTRLRSDEAGPTLTPDEALGGAPARDGDAFSVPKVIE